MLFTSDNSLGANSLAAESESGSTNVGLGPGVANPIGEQEDLNFSVHDQNIAQRNRQGEGLYDGLEFPQTYAGTDRNGKQKCRIS